MDIVTGLAANTEIPISEREQMQGVPVFTQLWMVGIAAASRPWHRRRLHNPRLAVLLAEPDRNKDDRNLEKSLAKFPNTGHLISDRRGSRMAAVASAQAPSSKRSGWQMYRCSLSPEVNPSN